MQAVGPSTVEVERRAFRCSTHSCQRVWWHDGRSALPLIPVDDRYSGTGPRQWHPCPECLDRQPAIALMGHHLRERTVETIGTWLRAAPFA